MKGPSEKFAAHNDILLASLEELKRSFVRVVNQGADITEFTKAIDQLDEFRRILNGTENIGFIVSVDRWCITAFPLTGDPEKDACQIATNIPKTKMN